MSTITELPQDDADPAAAAANFWLAEVQRLARLSRIPQAREAFVQAQAAVAALALTEPRWQVELSLAHSRLLFFDCDVQASISTVLAAHDQAVALGLDKLAAECAAVAALHLLHVDRMDDSVEMAGQALRRASADEHRTRYLALLALATACQYVGIAPRAFALYRLALDAARRGGDERASTATIVRMSHEQAYDALRPQRAVDAEVLKQAVVGMRSAIQLDEAAGAPHDPDMHFTLAMLLRAQGEAAPALALLQACGPQLNAEGRPLLPLLLQTELACCELALGQLGRAQELAHPVQQRLHAAGRGHGPGGGHTGAAEDGAGVALAEALADPRQNFEKARIHDNLALVQRAKGETAAAAASQQACGAILAQMDSYFARARQSLEAALLRLDQQGLLA